MFGYEAQTQMHQTLNYEKLVRLNTPNRFEPPPPNLKETSHILFFNFLKFLVTQIESNKSKYEENPRLNQNVKILKNSICLDLTSGWYWMRFEDISNLIMWVGEKYTGRFEVPHFDDQSSINYVFGY
ncbi:hypothetical protein RF11_06115 [Thelohanellus kitauei]|uniref:Uncharacterized protein n=1 Tax=Thelohanellus kitauei TaxID=669202 RepID=A0A0C2IVL4_THEKT|nr:hypothetical protein RF11_06115 [Thelohanellus kitauei]